MPTGEPGASTAIDPADCLFYHTVDVPGVGVCHGQWDLRGRFDDYVGGENLAGATVLDVGTATGFLTFEAERRGATVTSFDIDDASRQARLPFAGGLYATDRAAWRALANSRLERFRRGYWLCHRAFNSRATARYGTVYEIGPALGRFDVVLMGQILVHLRDAISAIEAAASVCDGRLIIVEGSFEDPDPVARLLGRHDAPRHDFAFYHYSRGWYENVLRILGFRSVRFATGTYTCNVATHAQQIELTTIVGYR